MELLTHGREHHEIGDGGCWGSLQKLKFSTHHQDQSMEFTRNEREVHLHTFEDCDAEVLQERGRWSRTQSDSDRGRF